MKRIIVFDFDGVIADSEILANAVLAEIVTELGTPMTLEASLQTFTGRRFDEVIALDSTIAEAFVKKGMALEKLGNLDGAIDCFERALELEAPLSRVNREPPFEHDVALILRVGVPGR